MHRQRGKKAKNNKSYDFLICYLLIILVKAAFHQVVQVVNRKMSKKIENVVFEGGGVLGYAYVGAAQVLEERNIVAKCFAGSSAGAMAAGLLACRATSKQLETALNSLDLKEMVDSSYFPPTNAYRLWYRGGWAKGNRLEQWYGDLIAQLCDGQRDITLQQVYDKFGTSIVLTGTCLQLHNTDYFMKESHPNMKLVQAVRISAGFPCVYPMVEHESKLWWDGGIGDNYPMHVFDHHGALKEEEEEGQTHQPAGTIYVPPKHCTNRFPNTATIGFKLVSLRNDCCQGDCLAHAKSGHAHQKTCTEIHNVYDALKSVASMIFEMSRRVHVHEIDWKRSVIIDAGQAGALDFDLTDQQKISMVQNARNATIAYLDALDSQTE